MAQQLFQRLDVEIALMGLSTGTLATLLAARAGEGGALLTGAAWGVGVIAGTYAIRIVGQALPLPSMGELGAGFAHSFGHSVSALPVFGQGLQVQLSRGPVDESPAPVVSDADLWRLELRRFLVAARLNGDSFSMRALIARGFVTDTAYRKLSAPLKAAGVLEPSKAGTDYAPGFSYPRAWRAIRDGQVPLPAGRPPRVTL